jgi:hypothetical protein
VWSAFGQAMTDSSWYAPDAPPGRAVLVLRPLMPLLAAPRHPRPPALSEYSPGTAPRAHPVQRLGDRHHGDRSVAQQTAQRRHVSISAEHPAHVADASLTRSLPGAAQHVRLGIHAERRTDPARQGQGKLPRSTAQIHYYVLSAQPEKIRKHVDHGTGIAVPVPVVELDHLAAET